MSLAETNREFLHAAWSAATAGAQAPIDLDAGDFLTREGAARRRRGEAHLVDASARSRRSRPSDADPALAAALLADSAEYLRLDGGATPVTPGKPAELLDHVASRLRHGWSAVVTAAGRGLVERAARRARASASLAARQVDELPERARAGRRLHHARRRRGRLRAARDQARARQRARVLRPLRRPSTTARSSKLATRRKNVVDPLQLKAGDYVVHQTHGIGKLRRARAPRGREATRKRPAPGGEKAPEKVTREFLLHRVRADQARLPGRQALRADRPARPAHPLRRRRGAAAARKMGGSDWAAAKGKRPQGGPRHRRRARQALLARAWPAAGTRSAPDTPWQRELEEAFPFAETPDQLETIDEVKADMERPDPDGPPHLRRRRLRQDRGRRARRVQGDPGRQAGRDARADDAARAPAPRDVPASGSPASPCTCGRSAASRRDKEAKETIEGPRRRHGRHGDRHPPHPGSTASQFKDLGLVIIDEEQRFGVEHKDALKKLKTNVDILAMSATPIPRTLEMAVTGIREMSTLATPPEDRHPILTYVGAVRSTSRSPPPSAASCCARARSSTCTTGCHRSTGSPPSSPSSCRRRASPSRTGRCASTCSSR